MEEPLKTTSTGCDIPVGLGVLILFIYLGFLMDMFQTPILPEPSPLDESEERFEAFCRKSGRCYLCSSLHDISCLYFPFPPPTSPDSFEISNSLSR